MANEDAERSAPRSDPEGDRSASSASDSDPKDADATEPDAADTETTEPDTVDTETTEPDAVDTDTAEEDSADGDATGAEPEERHETADPDGGVSVLSESDERDETNDGAPVVTDRYTWRSLLTERGREDAAERVYADVPDAPVVPADAVAFHLPNGVDRVVRAPGVDEPFEADGETEVPGHGTPERGTLVAGTDAVVLDGAAVVPTGERVAAPATPESAEKDEREKDVADEGDSEKTGTPRPSETLRRTRRDPAPTRRTRTKWERRTRTTRAQSLMPARTRAESRVRIRTGNATETRPNAVIPAPRRSSTPRSAAAASPASSSRPAATSSRSRRARRLRTSGTGSSSTRRRSSGSTRARPTTGSAPRPRSETSSGTCARPGTTPTPSRC
ncbi:hypothetical protein [Halorubrum distributum]|uniref:Type II secretion system protein E n=1 Tax=Halorubrum distributum JCM 13916 TaxID=1230455 RepID=M0PQL8_9EURY|nr:type II secretion system protein E [Halorubrum arcis JCM 13916]